MICPILLLVVLWRFIAIENKLIVELKSVEELKGMFFNSLRALRVLRGQMLLLFILLGVVFAAHSGLQRENVYLLISIRPCFPIAKR
ncbi:MAG: hypothetical protein U9P07_06185 [Pseudomonadota bacterium]|nr:hypothetical protein [Pseudomonadota bacterium]